MTADLPSSPDRDELQTEALVQELRKHLPRPEHKLDANKSTPSSTQSLPQLRNLVQDLQNRWIITPQPLSSRFPLIQKLIGPFWLLWNKAFNRWYLPTFLQQQINFNASVVNLAQHVELLLNMLEGERGNVRDDTADYERASMELTRNLAQVNLVLQKVAADLAVLQQQVDQGPLVTLTDRLTRLEGMLQNSKPVQARHTPEEGEPRVIPLPNFDYFAFERRFRGSPEHVKARQQVYVAYFQGDGPVVDVGCGRGEFLELLREAGIPSRGVDSDAGMVAYCQQRGLEVSQGDLFDLLAAEEDGTLGGIFSAQVIEHLPPHKILELFHLSYQKLAPGGVLLAETINPMCLLALASHYTIDLSHRQPVHPDTAAFLAESVGFADVQVRYGSPVPEPGRLQPVAPPSEAGLEPWQRVLNENVRKLNDLLYTYQEYAVIARKPAPEPNGTVGH